MVGPSKLHVSGGPRRLDVTLDGQEIGNALTGVTVTLGSGQFPTAELHAAILTADVDGEMVVVKLPEATRALLVQLGWTPPPDGPSATTPDEPAPPVLDSTPGPAAPSQAGAAALREAAHGIHEIASPPPGAIIGDVWNPSTAHSIADWLEARANRLGEIWARDGIPTNHLEADHG